MRPERGVTLIELIVVIVLIGLMASSATVSLIPSGPVEARLAGVAQCRDAAAEEGRPVATRRDTVQLLCLADGQVVGARAGQFVGEWP